MSKSGLYPFISKLYSLVSASENAPYVSWESSNRFVVWNPSEFSSTVLPKYFKHNNFCSFVRQLNIYGFHKSESDSWIFEHEDGYFQKDRPELLEKIHRRTQKRSGSYLSNSEERNKLKKEAETKEYLSTVHTEEVNRLKAMNDYLYAEIDSIRRKSQSQQATINWLINEFRKAKEEIELLKSFQQLSIDYESSNKSLDKNTIQNNMQPHQPKQHLPISSQPLNPPHPSNNNLYLTNEVFLQDYSIPSSFVPMMNQKYQTEVDNTLFSQETLSSDMMSSTTYSPQTENDFSITQNEYPEKSPQETQYQSNLVDYSLYS